MTRTRAIVEIGTYVLLVSTLLFTLYRAGKIYDCMSDWKKLSGEQSETIKVLKKELSAASETEYEIIPLTPELVSRLERVQACKWFIAEHPEQAYNMVIGSLKSQDGQGWSLRRSSKGVFLKSGHVIQRVSSFECLQDCELYRGGKRVTLEDLSSQERSALNRAQGWLEYETKNAARTHLLGRYVPESLDNKI